MKRVIALFFLMFFGFSLSAQRYDIKGVVTDTTGIPLLAATIMLMDIDSILIEFVQTDGQGNFAFKSVRDKNCLIKTTYLGYFPLTVGIQYKGGNVDLGVLRMTEISSELMEIVIKEAKAPLRMRGDTVEYDASQFKVPLGSTLEDLLKRLPGLEVSQDGTLLADGKGITKLTVDGKTFFSDDPKFAIKNLPAAGVSKVQVFDKKNEEALLTGQSAGSQEKAMNIELKEEFKKGGFGKVTAGGGLPDNRAELKGNYNKFDSKNQLSFIGVANNTGRNGLSWDDYQDFMGANSWGGNEDYDYGFGSSGFRFFSGGGSGLESKVSSSFFSGNDGGFPTNILTGVNYNYDHKKNKAAARYFFQNTGNTKTTTSDTRTFLSNFSLDNNRIDNDDKTNINHRAETMFQHDFDSLLTAIVTADVAFVNNNSAQNGGTNLRRDGEQLTSTSNYDNSSDLEGRLLNTSLLLRKKFKKAGRAIGVNGSYLKTDIIEDQKRFSDNLFFNDAGVNDSTLVLRQFNNDALDKTVLKFNALVSEPLTKKIFFKLFYNYSSRIENGNRTVNDQNTSDETLTLNNLLSRKYNNNISNQRTGTSLNYSHKGLNLTLGGAYQNFDLKGNYESPDTTLFKGRVDNKFDLWLPYVGLNGSVTRNSWLSADYTVSANEPSIEDLLPVVDFSNPFYITEGNPNLLPTVNQELSLWYSHSWPSSAVRVSIGSNFTYFTDQVITNQQVDENLVTRSRPLNYTGGTEMWNNFNLSFPIVRNRIKARFATNYSLSKSFAFVNDILNTTNTNRWSPSLTLDFTPTDKTALYLSSSVSVGDTKYDINTTQDQTIIRQNYNVDFSTNFAKG